MHASRLIPDARIVPGLIKIYGYTRISQYLIVQIKLVDGRNFHTFPYDWRLAVTVSYCLTGGHSRIFRDCLKRVGNCRSPGRRGAEGAKASLVIAEIPAPGKRPSPWWPTAFATP